jgi:hypothetical protein
MRNTALIAILFGVSVCLSAACKTTTETLKGATTAAQQAASVLALPPSQNPVEDVMNAFQRLEAASSYRLETHYPGSSRTSLMEYVAPDRRHNSIGGQMEFIEIGKDVYRKEKDQPWVKETGLNALVSGLAASDAALGFIKPEKGQAIKYVEAQMKDGLATRGYTYESKISFQTMKRTIWIRASDGLPHLIEAENIIEPEKKGDGGVIKYSVRFTYDPNLKIEPPI